MEGVKYNAVVKSAAEQEGDPNSLLTHYKRLIRVRTKNHALYAGKFSPIESENPSIVAYNMKSDRQSAIILHNLAQTEQSISSLDLTGYTLEFCQKKDGFVQDGNQVVMPPLSTVIFVRDLN